LFAIAENDDRAMQDFAEAIKLRSSSAAIFNALKYRGILRMRRSEIPLAENDFDAATKISPKRAAVLYGRGVARRLMGAQGPGDSDIAAAILLQPDIAEEMAKEGVKP
jgi:hypothetical protein